MLEYTGPHMKQIGLLILQPSPFCNIDCDYCYLADRASTKKMSLEQSEVAVIGYLAALAIPAYQTISSSCKGERLQQPGVTETCRRVAKSLQNGDTYVTVSGGGSTETFIFAGTTIGASLTLQSDGQGGDIASDNGGAFHSEMIFIRADDPDGEEKLEHCL